MSNLRALTPTGNSGPVREELKEAIEILGYAKHLLETMIDDFDEADLVLVQHAQAKLRKADDEQIVHTGLANAAHYFAINVVTECYCGASPQGVTTADLAKAYADAADHFIGDNPQLFG